MVYFFKISFFFLIFLTNFLQVELDMKNSSQFFHDRRLRLQCVNGDWINSLGATSLKGLACESCVQVGASGYAAFDERDEQEIFFFVMSLWKLFWP